MSILEHYKRSYRLLDVKVRWFLVLTAVLFSCVGMLDLIGLSLIFPIAKLLSGDTSFLMHDKLTPIRDMIGDFNPKEIAAILSVCFFVLLVIKGIVATAVTYWTSRVLQLVEARFVARLFQAYINAPASYHLAHNSSTLIRNLHENSVRLFRTTAYSMAQMASELVLSAGIVSILIYADPWSALISVLILGLGGGGYGLVVSKILSRMATESHVLSEQFTRVMRESLDSVSETRVFGKTNFFLQEFGRIRMRVARISSKTQTIMFAPRLVLEALVGLLVMSIILILISSGKDGEEVMTILILYAIAAIRLMPIVTRVVSTVSGARVAVPGVIQLTKDVEEFGQEIIIDRPWSLPKVKRLIPGKIPGFQHRLEVRNISHFYQDDTAALNDITLTIEQGQSIGLVGHSGAGKTTLAGVILGLVHPSKGEVLIDGDPMDLDEPAIQRSIGYVPQHFSMLDDSIRANVAFGVPADEIDDEWVVKALEQADLMDFVRTLPEGINARIGERGVRLSGGQRQRVGIARALYYDPAILLLDEATSALDVETEARISKVIRNLHGDKTLIIIAHRLSTVQNCDKIVFMKDGRVVSVDTFENLINENGEFKNLVDHGRLAVHLAGDQINDSSIHE